MNKPAFPRPISQRKNTVDPKLIEEVSGSSGMSLLEYYAGQALIGELKWMSNISY